MPVTGSPPRPTTGQGGAKLWEPKFSYDARKVLQKVRAASGYQCGKYLPAVLDSLEHRGDLPSEAERVARIGRGVSVICAWSRAIRSKPALRSPSSRP